jgi:hypothetical protein
MAAVTSSITFEQNTKRGKEARGSFLSGCAGRGRGGLLQGGGRAGRPPLLLHLPEALRYLEPVGQAGPPVEEDVGVVLGVALRQTRFNDRVVEVMPHPALKTHALVHTYKQCFRSGSGLDPDSIRSVDPYPDTDPDRYSD